MRSRLAGLVLWFAATGLATLMVSSGVGAIRDAARGEPLVARPSASEGAAADTAELVPTTIEESATAATSTAPSAAGSAPSSSASPVVGTVPAEPPPSPSSSVGVPFGSPQPPPPSPPPSVTETTTSAPPDATTESVSALGGTVTVRFTASAVTVIAATPAPGFSASVEQRGPLEVRVEFEGDHDRSRIEASWDGRPIIRVQED